MHRALFLFLFFFFYTDHNIQFAILSNCDGYVPTVVLNACGGNTLPSHCCKS